MLAFVCAVCALIAPGEVPKDLVLVHRIVMMGDSITQLGGEPGGYVTLVANTLKERYPQHPIEVVNAGISGEKAPNMLARFKRDVLDRKPELVTLSVGVNDVWHDFRTPEWTARVSAGNSGRGVKLADYLRDVESMVDAAQKAGIRIVLLSPSLIYEDLGCAENARLGQYVRAEEALAKRKRVAFVDLNASFRKVVSAYQKEAGKRQLVLTEDGVHLNDAGNALFADKILSLLGVPAPDQVSP